mgnify:CR=1 FL=1
MEPVELQNRLGQLFPPADRAEAEALLERECGAGQLFIDAKDQETITRVRCAVLKLSAGSLPALREAIRVARQDWRDSLVGADFAHRVLAHREWLASGDKS